MISRAETRGLQPDFPFSYFNRTIPGLQGNIAEFISSQQPQLDNSQVLQAWVQEMYGIDGSQLDAHMLPELCQRTEELIDYLKNSNPAASRALRLRVAHLQSLIQHHLVDQLQQGGEAARAIEYVTPVLPIYGELGEALRYVVLENGHYQAFKRDRSFSDTTPSATIPLIMKDNAVLSQAYGTEKFNDDLYDRLFQPRSLQEALSFRHAMEQTAGQSEMLRQRLRSLAGAYVGAYELNYGTDIRQELAKGSYGGFFFNWIFLNDDCSNYGFHGYTDVIKYPLEHVQQLTQFLEETYQGLGGMQQPYSRDGLRSLHLFTETGALQAFQNLLASRGTSLTAPSESSKGRGGGRKGKMEFDDHDRHMRGYDAYGYGSGYGNWDPVNLRSKGGIKAGDTASTIASTYTPHYRRELAGLRSSVLDLDYLIRWRSFYDKLEGRTSYCTPQISLRDTELIINNGKNLPLVVHAEDPDTIVPNSIHLGAHMSTLCLAGANGGGKTHLLEMITNNTILAHRGLYALADSMRSPVFGGMEYGVNQAIHTVGSSAFQNWVHYLKGVLRTTEELHGRPGMVVLDEPGRGTGAKDAIPLIIGLMKYFQDRGVRFSFSTHFNDLYRHRDLLDEYGLTCGFYTMNRQTHEMVAGMGKSEGLAVARERGMNAEVIGIADEIYAQADNPTISLSLPEPSKEALPSEKTRPFAALAGRDLKELRISNHIKPGRDSYDQRNIEYHSTDESSDIFGSYATFGYYRGMSPEASEAFNRQLTAQLTEAKRTERITTFESLLTLPGRSDQSIALEPQIELFSRLAEKESPPGVNTQIRDILVQLQEAETQKTMSKADQLHEAVSIMKNFATLFSLGQERKGTRENPENILNTFLISFAGLSGETQERQYYEFKRQAAETPLLRILTLVGYLDQQFPASEFPALQESLGYIREFAQSEAYTQMRDFWSNNSDLKQLKEADWNRWVNICLDNSSQILKLHRTILDLHFYSTVGKTIQNEQFVKVEETEDEYVIEGLYSPALRYLQRQDEIRYEEDQKSEWMEPEKRMKAEDIQRVVSSDVRFSRKQGILPISGTNGGGKSQGLLAFGAAVFYAEQLGYAPATVAKIPRHSFIAAAVNTAEHTQEQSSWQNEVDVLKQVITDYEAAGSPSGGVVLLDEPGKGTSGEEAIPLLLGVMHYFQKRGVTVMFTTHFTGVFDYLDRLDKKSSLAVHPLHVDFFSDEPEERYKLKDGIGESAGVRVAEEMGLPEEIIAIAREAQRRMKD